MDVQFEFFLDFWLRTSQDNGLILHSQQSSEGDYFGVYLTNGEIRFQVDLGSGSEAVQSTDYLVNDGSWHHIYVVMEYTYISLTIDSQFMDFIMIPQSPQTLTVIPFLFMGGVSNSSILNPSVSHLPGLVGCIANFSFEGNVVPILQSAVAGDHITSCVGGACNPGSCSWDGVCVEDPPSTGGYTCLCPLGLTGATCEQGKGLTTFLPSASLSHLCSHLLSRHHHNHTLVQR